MYIVQHYNVVVQYDFMIFDEMHDDVSQFAVMAVLNCMISYVWWSIRCCRSSEIYVHSHYYILSRLPIAYPLFYIRTYIFIQYIFVYACTLVQYVCNGCITCTCDLLDIIHTICLLQVVNINVTMNMLLFFFTLSRKCSGKLFCGCTCYWRSVVNVYLEGDIAYGI